VSRGLCPVFWFTDLDCSGVGFQVLKSFQELEVWQKAHHLALQTYRVTDSFPDRERFGVVSQIRRSAASIPANIAEGFGRRTTKELSQFLTNTNGSLEETRYFLILSRDLGSLKGPDFEDMEKQCSSVAQMISGLGRSLKSRLAGVHGSRSTVHGSRTDG
jgi:four helix bundle protein